MFNPTQIVITAFVRELREMYDRSYGTLEFCEVRRDATGLVAGEPLHRHSATTSCASSAKGQHEIL